MYQMRLKLTLAVICFACLGIQISSAETVINKGEAATYLYAVAAKSGTFKDGKLELKDAPLVVYFTDVPHRVAGMLSLEVFAQGWDKGPGSLRADPPNATLSYMENGSVKSVIVELGNPSVDVDKASITFDTRELKGELPTSFGKSTLFLEGSGAELYQQ
jgi:hypothetical protein